MKSQLIFYSYFLVLFQITKQTRDLENTEKSNYNFQNLSTTLFYKNNELFFKDLMKISNVYTKNISQVGIINLLNSQIFCLNEMCPNSNQRGNIIRIIFGQISNVDEFKIENILFKITYFNKEDRILVGMHGPITCVLLVSGNYIYYGSGLYMNYKNFLIEQKPIINVLSEIDKQINTVLII